MVGAFILGLAIASPIFQLFDLQLKVVLASDARNDYHFRDYLGLRLISMTIGLIILSAISISCYGISEISWITIAIGFGFSVEMTSTVFYGLFQKHERMRLIATSMTLKGGSNVACVVLAVFLTGSILTGVIALCVSRLFWLVAYDIPRASEILGFDQQQGQAPFWAQALPHKQVLPQFDVSRLIRLARATLPLGANIFFSSLAISVPRYFVKNYCDLEMLGIYGSIAYVLVVLNTVTMALAHATIPRLSKYSAELEKRAFIVLWLKTIALLIVFLCLGGIVVYFAGGFIISRLYTPEFSAYNGTFMILYIAGCLQCMSAMAAACLIARRCLTVQVVLGVTNLCATFLSCLIFVPRFRIQGAAYASVIGFTAQVLLALILCVRSINNFNKRKTTP